jgi:dihydrofolate reductase
MELGMRRLSVFNNVSLDGYFTDAMGEMRWADQGDPEWREFTAANANSNGVLLFGRVTYDLMIKFWPTPVALQMMPDVANGMNQAQKIVFSRTLDKATWNNTTIVKNDLVAQVRRLKNEPGAGMVILGSGQIVSQLTGAGLIDEYQIAVAPVVLGAGRTMFEGVMSRPRLRRTFARNFANGTVFLRYEAMT